VTFHVVDHLDFTILVDESITTFAYKHCLCTMFVFQPGSLYISKDILYDSNNLVLSLLY
jgi:hypothetical protein